VAWLSKIVMSESSFGSCLWHRPKRATDGPVTAGEQATREQSEWTGSLLNGTGG